MSPGDHLVILALDVSRKPPDPGLDVLPLPRLILDTLRSRLLVGRHDFLTVDVGLFLVDGFEGRLAERGVVVLVLVIEPESTSERLSLLPGEDFSLLEEGF